MPRNGGKSILAIVLAINSVLMALFGVGFFTVLDQLRLIYNLPERVEKVEKILVHQDKVNEMNWQFGRNMTDDTDTVQYFLSYGSGTDDKIHEVDVRSNNDNYVMAFIHDLWIIYPLRVDPAERGRKVIDFMDPETGEENYIPLRPQPR